MLTEEPELVQTVLGAVVMVGPTYSSAGWLIVSVNAEL
jgi:hypothetical protein